MKPTGRILPYSTMGFITMNNHNLGDYFCHFFQASKSRNLQVSHEKKILLLSMKFWLFNRIRNPYTDLLWSPQQNCRRISIPNKSPRNNQGFLVMTSRFPWGRFELPEFHLRSNPHVISDWCGRGARVADARVLDRLNVVVLVVGFTGGKEGKTVLGTKYYGKNKL